MRRLAMPGTCDRAFRLVLMGAVLLATRARAEGPADDFFEKEVRPLLVERCAECHDEARGKVKGGLRLTSRASVLEGGDGGPAAVSGRPEESPLIQAIRYEDEPRMPPKGKLDDREIATLTRWVEMGLPWPEARVEVPASAPAGKARPDRFSEEQRRFWSFRPVREVGPPDVGAASWPRSDIDRFILAGLEANGLAPAPEADRRTWLRRATFDLTGLPPTPEEIDAFLADASPEAWGKVVDRLLASPRYGERWGRHWLDLVRYADSRDARGIGGADDIGEAWRYRDWVVDAFNRDLPYDAFVVDQIAGDLLPPPEPGGFNAEGLVATGLLAIGEWGTGDADKEKMMTDIVDDQIDVVGRAFLGLTVACARCHDHKFDPIPQEDYYGLAGIFFSTHILPEPGAKTAGSPLLRTPIVPRATVDAAARHKARVAELESEIKRIADEQDEALVRSLLPETARYMMAAWEFRNPPGGAARPTREAFAAARGLRADALRNWIAYLGLDEGRPLDRPVRDLLGRSGVDAWRGEADSPSLTLNANDREVALLTFKLPARSVSVHPGPASAVAVAWTSPIAGTVRVSGRLADADPAGGDGVAWSIHLGAGAGGSRPLASGDLANGYAQRFEAGEEAGRLAALDVRPGDVIRLVVAPKAHHTCDTTAVEMVIAREDGSATWDLTRDLLADPVRVDRPGDAGPWHVRALEPGPVRARPGRADTPLGRWDRAARAVAVGEEDQAAIDRAAREVQGAIDRADDPGQGAALRKELASPGGPFRVRVRDDPSGLAPEARETLARLEAELQGLKANPPPPIPVALAAQEGGVPKSAHAGIRDARIHIRGNYRRLGEVVPRHFPGILAGDDQSPIASGSGRLELARWIARAENPLTARVMVNRIWQHHFGSGIVRTPSNFGKLGMPPTHPELLDFLAGRFVASGWSVKAMHRAIMLSATYRQSCSPSPEATRIDPENRLFGRMNRRRLESEAVRDGLLVAAGRLDATMGGPSVRDLSSPRRTVYLMTIRSDRSSFGPLFDAADATAIVDTRTVSTVAPQALFLMNHPLALDSARALASRARGPGADDDRDRIRRLYVLLYGRPAADEEVEIGLEALAQGREGSGADADDRAWEAYCQLLLCTNEFLFID